MNSATVYDDQGRIIAHYMASDAESLAIMIDGRNFLPGQIPFDHYIQDGDAVPMGPKPDNVVLRHEFDYIEKTWKIDRDRTAIAARTHREDLLSVIDRVNPVWYASLTAEQQAELQAYRQSLLDVPQQAGFPDTVEWPQQPSWL